MMIPVFYVANRNGEVVSGPYKTFEEANKNVESNDQYVAETEYEE